MVLALVLGDMAEQSMRQALIIGHGNPLVFFKLPLALPLMAAAIIIFFWPVIGPWKAKLFAKKT